MTQPSEQPHRDRRREALNTLEEIIEGTEADRIGSYEPLKKWVHRKAREVRSAIEAAVPDPVASPAPLDRELVKKALSVCGVYDPTYTEMFAAEYARLEGQPAGEEPEG